MCARTYTHINLFWSIPAGSDKSFHFAKKKSFFPPFQAEMVEFLNDAPHMEQILSLAMEIRQ